MSKRFGKTQRLRKRMNSNDINYCNCWFCTAGREKKRLLLDKERKEFDASIKLNYVREFKIKVGTLKIDRTIPKVFD